MQLEFTDAKAVKMNQIEDAAIDVLKEALETGEVSDASNIAMKALNMVARNRTTLTARSAIAFHMATAIGDDAGIARYVKATSPSVIKALAGKE